MFNQETEKILTDYPGAHPGAGGISHSPLEFSRPSDIEKGVSVLLKTLFKVDML